MESGVLVDSKVVAYGSLKVVFLRQNWIILQILFNLSLSLCVFFYAIDMIKDINKMKYNLFYT